MFKVLNGLTLWRASNPTDLTTKTYEPTFIMKYIMLIKNKFFRSNLFHKPLAPYLKNNLYY